MKEIQDGSRDKKVIIGLGVLGLCAVASVYDSFVPSHAMAVAATLAALALAAAVMLRIFHTRMWLRSSIAKHSNSPIQTKAMVGLTIVAPSVLAFLAGLAVFGNAFPCAITLLTGESARIIVVTSDASWFDVKRRECIMLKLAGRPSIMIGGRVMCGRQFENTIVPRNTRFAFSGTMTPMGINVTEIQRLVVYQTGGVP